jgi:hypothetical protein
MTRPWPSRYLVPECMIRSAPSLATGRCSAGVAKAVVHRQQSAGVVGNIGQRLGCHTHRSAGWWASRQTAAGCWAARLRATAATSVCDTKVDFAHQTWPGRWPDELDGGAKHRLRAHHVVTGLEQAHAHHQDGRHAGCRGNGRLGAFQRSPAAAPNWSPSGCRSGHR